MPYCKKCGNELIEEADFCPKCGTHVETLTVPLAHWGERFIGWLIDILILGAFLTLARLSLGPAWLGLTFGPSFLRWIPLVDFGLNNIVYFLYWMLMEGFYGQSVGKIIMRLEVTRLDGKAASVAQTAIESIGKAFLLPIDCIIGWILYTRRRQRLFNFLSETIVVKTHR